MRPYEERARFPCQVGVRAGANSGVAFAAASAKPAEDTMKPIRSSLLMLPILGALSTQGLNGGDWPRYLGPAGDGRSDESGWRTDWSDKEPARLWEASVGLGCASFVVADGRAVTTGNIDDVDHVWCFDAASGKVLWKHTFNEGLDPKYYSGGTSATPAIDEGRVYSVSKDGKLFCLDLETGAVAWSKDFQADFDGRRPTWGWASSPGISGDLLLVNPGAKDGAVVALDKKDGSVRWKAGDSQPGYAAPLFYDHGGEPAVAWFHAKELVGYRMSDGKELFSHPWKTRYDVNASKPHFRDGRFFVASGYGTGAGLIEVAGGKAEETFTSRDFQLQFQNSLLLNGRIIAMFGDQGDRAGELAAIEFASGKLAWSHPMAGKRGSVIEVDGKLIVLSELGELVVGTVEQGGFAEIGRTQTLPKLCWAAPAFAGGRIFIRNNDGKALCLDVR